LNSGKSPDMFCLGSSHRASSEKPQNKLVSSGWWSWSTARTWESSARDRDPRALLERSARARRVQSVTAQDRDSHSTADRTRTGARISTSIRTRTRTRTERVSLGQ